ncbi:MAG: 4Fe-4S dicluster domain-containing protein [Planctomycetota bacterium]
MDDLHRRAFFGDTLRRALNAVSDFVPAEARPVKHLRLLRPPGAIGPERFSDTCRRCGECVRACPASAIFPLETSISRLAGTPNIDPAKAACVLCEGLKCTHVCPSGALQALTESSMVRMGLAKVSTTRCVRTIGDPCDECVVRCPLGARAIRLAGAGPPEIVVPGCTGCGVCELYCPTSPKAVIIRPL